MTQASTTVLVHRPTPVNGSVYPDGGTCPPRRTSNAAKRLREHLTLAAVEQHVQAARV